MPVSLGRRLMLVVVLRARAHPDGMNPGLRAELLRRMERDQVARRADDSEAFGQVDAENLPWLKGDRRDWLAWAIDRRRRWGPAPPGCWCSTPTAIRRSSGSAWTC